MKTTMTYDVTVMLPDDWRGKVKYRLNEPICAAGYHAPVGFETDGASVPRFAWPLFPPVGRYFAAAAIHDYLLRLDYSWPNANRAFRSALIDLGVRGWRIHVIMAAVRLNGVRHRVLRHLG